MYRVPARSGEKEIKNNGSSITHHHVRGFHHHRLVHESRKAPALSLAESQAAGAAPNDEIVAGFHLPKRLRYHAGHTWVQRERKNLNRVGADEFARHLRRSRGAH